MDRLFSFPNPVNDVAARTVASGVAVLCVVTIASHQLWITILLAYGFVARVASGPRFSPLARLATGIVAPKLLRRAKMVPGPPKRFAQAIGAIFSCIALGLWLGGHGFASEVLVACLIVPALLEAGLGYCVGCKLFAIMMRAGVIPSTICEECADIYGASARLPHTTR